MAVTACDGAGAGARDHPGLRRQAARLDLSFGDVAVHGLVVSVQHASMLQQDERAVRASRRSVRARSPTDRGLRGAGPRGERRAIRRWVRGRGRRGTCRGHVGARRRPARADRNAGRPRCPKVEGQRSGSREYVPSPRCAMSATASSVTVRMALRIWLRLAWNELNGRSRGGGVHRGGRSLGALRSTEQPVKAVRRRGGRGGQAWVAAGPEFLLQPVQGLVQGGAHPQPRRSPGDVVAEEQPGVWLRQDDERHAGRVDAFGELGVSRARAASRPWRW